MWEMGCGMLKVNHKIFSEKEIVCNNIWSQAQGLIFRPRRNLIMIFPKERKISLHNFFVFYPLEIIVLDENKKVIEIKENFKPFTLWNSTKKGKYLIELGKEKSKRKIKLGETVQLSCC